MSVEGMEQNNIIVAHVPTIVCPRKYEIGSIRRLPTGTAAVVASVDNQVFAVVDGQRMQLCMPQDWRVIT